MLRGSINGLPNSTEGDKSRKNFSREPSDG